jgi:hypothetical protein
MLQILFCFRVVDIVKSGKLRAIVDPDPHQSYTRAKLARNNATSSANISCPASTPDIDEHDNSRLPGKMPKDGWVKDLKTFPVFTFADMIEHAQKSGTISRWTRIALPKNQWTEDTNLSSNTMYMRWRSVTAQSWFL